MANRGRENKEINKSKFTIVLTNYNNEQYIEDSLVSIFNQTYDNIELIITDDASKNFNKCMIEELLKKYSPKNIKEIKYIINNVNIGTVKTLNKALNLVTGEFVLFFATDDKLGSNDIIQNYVNLFKNECINVITSNWIMCDENLKAKKYFQKVSFLKKFNNKNTKKQYAQLCKTNIYGAGSTSYRTKIFKKYGNFDENFRYLEDWPLWLKLTRNNEKIYYANFDGLFHRDGGISHDKKVNQVKVDFFKEILELYKNNIIKNIDCLGNLDKINIINSYLYSINFYSKYFDTNEYLNSAIKYINDNKKFKFASFLYGLCPKYIKKLKILLRLNKGVVISFILTILLTFLIINFYNFTNKNLFLLFVVVFYIIVYYFTCTILNIYLSKRG